MSVEGAITARTSPSQYELRSLVLQPTGFCNIDCRYCYLADRESRARMPIAIAEKIADGLVELNCKINLIWHAGEPLSVGEHYLRELFSCFESLRQKGLITHSVQTNGTLIDDRWCEFFNEFSVSVGLSIDGPQHLNSARVDRRGQETFEKVVAGARALRRNSIPFTTISVISRVVPGIATELLAFLGSLGTLSAAFNIVEMDGASRSEGLDDEAVRQFWQELRCAWERDPSVQVREIRQIFEFARFICVTPDAEPPLRDWLLSIDVKGRVRAVSPELMEMRSEKYADFVIANVMTDGLSKAILKASDAAYVKDFFGGVDRCASSCDYFAFCRGGSLSNKLAELDDLASTETRYCRQSRKLLWDAFAPMLLEEA
jgi:uncharacterized protein